MYSIALHGGKEFFSVGISNPKTGEIIALNQFSSHGTSESQRLENLFNSAEFSGISKNTSRLIYYSTSSNFALIPSFFFEEGSFASLAKKFVPVAENEEILATFIPEIDGYIAFTQLKNITQLLKSKQIQVETRHHFASLISAYHLLYAEENKFKAFIQFHHKQFSLCLMDGKKLISFTTFDIHSFEDILYYVYYSLEQHAFPIAKTELHIGGYYADQNSIMNVFKRYSATIRPIIPTCCPDLSEENRNILLNIILDVQCG